MDSLTAIADVIGEHMLKERYCQRLDSPIRLAGFVDLLDGFGKHQRNRIIQIERDFLWHDRLVIFLERNLYDRLSRRLALSKQGRPA